VQLSSTHYCTKKFVFWLSLLLPFTLILIHLGVNWWFLHILLNQIAAFVFNSFSFMFLKLRTVFACWAFIYLMLYIFRALVFHTHTHTHTQTFTSNCADYNTCTSAFEKYALLSLWWPRTLDLFIYHSYHLFIDPVSNCKYRIKYEYRYNHEKVNWEIRGLNSLCRCRQNSLIAHVTQSTTGWYYKKHTRPTHLHFSSCLT
jgi:hypothetical protein